MLVLRKALIRDPPSRESSAVTLMSSSAALLAGAYLLF